MENNPSKLSRRQRLQSPLIIINQSCAMYLHAMKSDIKIIFIYFQYVFIEYLLLLLSMYIILHFISSLYLFGLGLHYIRYFKLFIPLFLRLIETDKFVLTP